MWTLVLVIVAFCVLGLGIALCDHRMYPICPRHGDNLGIKRRGLTSHWIDCETCGFAFKT